MARSSGDDAVITTRMAYELDGAAWSARWGDRAFLSPRFDRMCELLDDRARVLDLGCGPGHDSSALSERGLRVVSLDLTRAMLEVARCSEPATKLLQGDSRSLPLQTGIFDGVWASASLLHLPKNEVGSALGEVRRILRGGGTFYSSMKLGDHDALMSQGQRGGGNPVRGDRYFAHYGTKEWTALLRGAGFEVVEQRVENAKAQLPDTPWILTYARAVVREAPAELHAIVRGRVQAVGFRYFVQRQATALGLRGWVRNLGDGSTVEVMAEGPRDALEALLTDLRSGPRHAAVDSVEVNWAEPSRAFSAFEIRG
jgi:acylphosphatase/2-polyprenyl-3-methyl-5-hydroxy-6-metoxy-1,4-benzoquinol methylase